MYVENTWTQGSEFKMQLSVSHFSFHVSRWMILLKVVLW